MKLEIGDKAPEFCLPNQDEIEICTRDLLGKWVVLFFYPKDNTPGCTQEACDFTAQIENFDALDAIVLGLSPDSSKHHRNFITKHNLKTTLLSDETKAISINYGVWQTKKLYGREYMGIVRSTFILNPEGNIAYIWRNVKIQNHVCDVKNKLKEIQN